MKIAVTVTILSLGKGSEVRPRRLPVSLVCTLTNACWRENKREPVVASIRGRNVGARNVRNDRPCPDDGAHHAWEFSGIDS